MDAYNTYQMQEPTQSGELSVLFKVGPSNKQVYFKSNQVELTASSEAFISFLLPCCLKKGGMLHFDGPVSREFITSIPSFVDLHCKWDIWLTPVKIAEAQIRKDEPSNGTRIGSFFTGGVDSFYTFIKHRKEITDLIFVYGFDIGLHDLALRKKVSAALSEIASEYNVRLIEIETNVREFLSPHSRWGENAHGAALAGIGHLLGPDFCRIYIPSSYTHTQLIPWGSHPLTDPLFSTEKLEIVHDGCEATRVQKIKFIEGYEKTHEHLRVCWSNPGSAYNCGNCEKCVRTLINIRAAGSTEHWPAFETPLTMEKVLNLKIETPGARTFFVENLDALTNSGEDSALIRTMTRVLRRPALRYRYRTAIKNIIGSSKKLTMLARKLQSRR